jgi:hypothetical protein
VSERINDGGPAFPNRGDNTPTNRIYDGMSLRDWFAGQAILCVLGYATGDNEAVATECYQIADAMLAAREKGSK